VLADHHPSQFALIATKPVLAHELVCPADQIKKQLHANVLCLL
jgi:hypothetical protein